MNGKEKFEKIIAEIEKNANDPYGIKGSELAQVISKELFVSFRTLSDSFAFLTGISMNDYITERQIMASYNFILGQSALDKQSMEQAIAISGYENHSSFGKKFKEVFNMSPKEAFAKCDESLHKSKLSWKMLESTQTTDEKIKYGIPNTQYVKILEAADYQSFYGLDDIQGEIAFQIAEKMNVSLKKAFKFVNDYYEYCRRVNGIDYGLNFELIPTILASNELLKYLYFNVADSIDDVVALIESAEEHSCDLMAIDKNYLVTYLEDGRWDFDEFMTIVQNFEELGGDDFDEYLELISFGFSAEDAVNAIDDNFEAACALLDNINTEPDFSEE